MHTETGPLLAKRYEHLNAEGRLKPTEKKNQVWRSHWASKSNGTPRCLIHVWNGTRRSNSTALKYTPRVISSDSFESNLSFSDEKLVGSHV